MLHLLQEFRYGHNQATQRRNYPEVVWGERFLLNRGQTMPFVSGWCSACVFSSGVHGGYALLAEETWANNEAEDDIPLEKVPYCETSEYRS